MKDCSVLINKWLEGKEVIALDILGLDNTHSCTIELNGKFVCGYNKYCKGAYIEKKEAPVKDVTIFNFKPVSVDEMDEQHILVKCKNCYIELYLF